MAAMLVMDVVGIMIVVVVGVIMMMMFVSMTMVVARMESGSPDRGVRRPDGLDQGRRFYARAADARSGACDRGRRAS